MGFRLSKRIYRIAEKVSPGETVADIGTDHGYVPMLLVKGGISPRAIMSDISEGSLAKARETFSIAGLNADDDDFRVGDGLDTILPSEVDDIIIAGLGGHTIVDILDADISKTRSYKKLIFQPRKHSGTLRFYLYTNGWDIVDEDLSPEGKFVCEIITAVPSEHMERIPPYEENDIRWKYPEAIVNADRDLAVKRIGWKISSIEEQISNLQSSAADHTEKISRLNNDLTYLKYIIAD